MNQPAFFLHIPRTAGTTLNAVLRDNFRPEEVLNVYKAEEYRQHTFHAPSELAGIRLIQGHLLLTNFDPPSMYGVPVRVFTFLREPVTRVISEYDFLRTWKDNHLYAYLHEHHTTLREYVQSDAPLLRYRGRNFMTRCISGMDVGKAPRPVRALARAKQHLEKKIGCVGIQERFMESLLLLGDFLGLTSLLHERRNALSAPSKTLVSDEDRALLQDLNQGDTELYAFACALFEERVAAAGPDFARRLREFSFLNANYQKISRLLLLQAEQNSGTELVGNEAIQLAKNTRW